MCNITAKWNIYIWRIKIKHMIASNIILIIRKQSKKGEILMLDKVIENNRVCIIGEVVSEFTFSHEVFGEGFYIANVSVNRLSDMVDIIPLMISERLIDVTKDYRGRKIEVSGQFRSYNRHEGVKNKLVLSIFVRELRFIEDDEVPEEQSK